MRRASKQRTKLIALSLVAGLGLLIGASSPSYAESARSDNFEVTDVRFDPYGGSQPACSDNYCVRPAIGDGLRAPEVVSSLAMNDLEDGEPQLDIAISHGATNIGELSVDAPATKTATINVRGYMSGGYMLYMIGESLRIGDHSLPALTKPTRSKPGHEQFGVNLVANRNPALGATLTSKLSDASPKISSDYDQADKFMFKSGDLIAQSPSGSSHDIYTLSMIVNISSATPPGKYDGGFSIMAVPGF